MDIFAGCIGPKAPFSLLDLPGAGLVQPAGVPVAFVHATAHYV